MTSKAFNVAQNLINWVRARRGNKTGGKAAA
jgi:hypothetical protein